MKFAYEHHRTKAEVRGLLAEALPDLLGRYGSHLQSAHHEWYADTLHFSAEAIGMALAGTAEVTDSELILEVKLPLLARPFEEPAKRRIIGHLDSLLAQRQNPSGS